MALNIVINNSLIRYYAYKKNGSNAILFLHGWRSEGAVWQDIALKLKEKNYSTYMMDLPGFGGSSVPKTPFSIDDYADIVSAFIKKMNLKHVILVGHSFGGRIAIRLSATKSQLIQKLVLVDSAGFIDRKRQQYQLYAKLIKPLFKPVYMQNMRTWIYKKIGAEDYVATPYLRETFLRVIKEDLTDNLSHIHTQTLLLWGEKDMETPVAYGLKMKEMIVNSQLVILPDAGHFSFLDQPQKFYNALIHFIEQQL